MLERLVPYDAQALLAVASRYHAGLWPAQPLVLCGLVVLVALWLRRAPHAPRLLAGALAGAWAWCGIGWEWRSHAMLNWAGMVFAALFVLQALLLAWSGVLRARLRHRGRRGFRACLGACLVLLALAGAPLAGAAWSGDWAAAPVAGVSPAPTAALTVGLLLLGAPPAPLHLLLVPLLWGAYALAVAWTLGLAPDVALVAATLAGIAVAAWPTRAPGG